MESMRAEVVKKNEEEEDLYETYQGYKAEKSESKSSKDGDSQGENGNNVTKETDQGTPNPAKEKPQEQETSEIKDKTHTSKFVACRS